MKTTLKKTVLLAVLLGFGLPLAIAQQEDDQDYAKRPAVTVDSTFQLSSFILPDFRRRSLVINGGLRNDLLSEHDYFRVENHNINPDIERDIREFQNRFSLTSNVSFSDIHYTRNRQRETRISSNIGLNIENDRNRPYPTELIRDSRFGFSPNVTFSQINRRYLNENVFWEYSPSFSYGFLINRSQLRYTGDVEHTSKERIFEQNLQPGITLGIGIGRIEPVGDARHAIHILDALARRGITSATKSAEDITRFAEFIAELKNKRFLDARHRRIYELEALDSFLFVNGFRDTLSMKYFTTLEDFWVHGNESRYSGWRISLSVTPRYIFISHTMERWSGGYIFEDLHRNRNTLSTNFGISFVYERPINLFWQNSFSASLNYHQQNIRDVLRHSLVTQRPPAYGFVPSFSFLLSQRISYFPTTRTQLFAGYRFSYDVVRRPRLNSRTAYTSSGLEASVDFGATYFFSPQLQLALRTGIGYSLRRFHALDDDGWSGELWAERQHEGSWLRFDFNLSLRYTFF